MPRPKQHTRPVTTQLIYVDTYEFLKRECLFNNMTTADLVDYVVKEVGRLANENERLREKIMELKDDLEIYEKWNQDHDKRNQDMTGGYYCVPRLVDYLNIKAPESKCQYPCVTPAYILGHLAYNKTRSGQID